MRFAAIAAAILLLAAIALCALTPSPNMREMWWIPGWLGEWADRHGNFRNFPVFAAFAALLFLVFNTSHAVVAPRIGGFVSRSFQLNTANCQLQTALRAAVCASALGILLEAVQVFLPHRWADPMDILWSTLGAFVGSMLAAAFLRLLPTASRAKRDRLQVN